MNTPRKPILGLIPVLLSLASCKKPATIAPIAPTSSDSAVYVLGTSGNSVVYWKNGNQTILSSDPEVYATGMVLSDSNIYVSGGRGRGQDQYDTLGTANYWKNGNLVSLPLVSGAIGANAEGLFVNGNDVYVAGTTHYSDGPGVPHIPIWGDIATCWKNGQPALLSDWPYYLNYFGYFENIHSSYTTGVFVSGNDVFLSGGERRPFNDPPPYHLTGYWKNNVFIDLPNNLADSTSNIPLLLPMVFSLVSSGSDVFATGIQLNADGFFQALYWKNGILTILTSSGVSGRPYSIALAGNDVYIVGYAQNYSPQMTTQHAAYWKNGQLVILDSSVYGSTGKSIFVSGNDVYVAGNKTYAGISYPTYWKNGVERPLGSDGDAYTIIVK